MTTDKNEVETPSGLRYVDIAVGKGSMPKEGQNVTVHYTVSVGREG
jgi:peptidylprolyl isomerase